jgi:hypothetical protein
MGDAGCIACAKQRDIGLSSEPEQCMAGIGERHREAKGEYSGEDPDFLRHGSPFLEPLISVPCMDELYRLVIPGGSPMG